MFKKTLIRMLNVCESLPVRVGYKGGMRKIVFAWLTDQQLSGSRNSQELTALPHFHMGGALFTPSEDRK